MSCHFHVLVCLLCLGVGPRLAAAQSPSTPSPPTAPPEQATAVALRVNTGESIAVDGGLESDDRVVRMLFSGSSTHMNRRAP